MGVRFQGATYNNITEVRDRDTDEATAKADELIDGDKIRTALIDRYHGLILFEGEATRDTKGYLFETPLCGYPGAGPSAAAEILSNIGFGSERELYERLAATSTQTDFLRR